MNIKHIIFDLDGVLTDGKQYIDASGGKQLKAVSARDKLGLKRLIAQGYQITILTMDDWAGTKTWFEGIGCKFFVTHRKNLFPIDKESTIGVGDDRDDYQWLCKCAYSYTVSDADPDLQEKKDITVLSVKGGAGVVNYIENILKLL